MHNLLYNVAVRRLIIRSAETLTDLAGVLPRVCKSGLASFSNRRLLFLYLLHRCTAASSTGQEEYWESVSMGFGSFFTKPIARILVCCVCIYIYKNLVVRLSW